MIINAITLLTLHALNSFDYILVKFGAKFVFVGGYTPPKSNVQYNFSEQSITHTLSVQIQYPSLPDFHCISSPPPHACVVGKQLKFLIQTVSWLSWLFSDEEPRTLHIPSHYNSCSLLVKSLGSDIFKKMSSLSSLKEI